MPLGGPPCSPRIIYISCFGSSFSSLAIAITAILTSPSTPSRSMLPMISEKSMTRSSPLIITIISPSSISTLTSISSGWTVVVLVRTFAVLLHPPINITELIAIVVIINFMPNLLFRLGLLSITKKIISNWKFIRRLENIQSTCGLFA